MQRTMIYRVSMLTGYATVRHTHVSLPYVRELVDGMKYLEPQDVPKLEGTTSIRRLAAQLLII